MSTIRSVLDSLSEQNKTLLNYAFQHDVPYFIKLEGGRYVGVHADKIPNLEPESTVGVWSTGKVKDAKQ